MIEPCELSSYNMPYSNQQVCHHMCYFAQLELIPLWLLKVTLSDLPFYFLIFKS